MKRRKRVQKACQKCDGMGYQTVTRDMAQSAGDPDMEGYQLRCESCRGDGWILERP